MCYKLCVINCVIKYKEVITDKVIGVSEKPAVSILLDSKTFRTASYLSGLTNLKTFAFIKIAART